MLQRAIAIVRGLPVGAAAAIEQQSFIVDKTVVDSVKVSGFLNFRGVGLDG